MAGCTAAASRLLTSSNVNSTSTSPRRQLRQHRGKLGQPEAEEFARKQEQFPQQVEAAEQPVVVGKERLLLVKTDLLQAVLGAGTTTGLPNSSSSRK